MVGPLIESSTDMNNERIVIGEIERAGLPISAPVYEFGEIAYELGQVRWRQTETSFVLEQFRAGITGNHWCEVMCQPFHKPS